MAGESEKYDRILKILRKSRPDLGNTDDIEEKVINRIILATRKVKPSFNILDFLFGWVYIGWVRTGLVAVSVLLLAAFGYEQAMILKRINNLNARTGFSESQIISGVSGEINDKLLFYRITEGKQSDKPIKISNRQLKKLIESINELQIKYNDLIRIIEENPELKKYIDEKITENDRKKLKL